MHILFTRAQVKHHTPPYTTLAYRAPFVAVVVVVNNAIAIALALALAHARNEFLFYCEGKSNDKKETINDKREMINEKR
jgi:hypothetical protein